MGRICLLAIVIVAVFFCTPVLCSYNQGKPQSSWLKGSLSVTVNEGLLSVDIRDAALEEVLRKLSDRTGISFSLPPSLSKTNIMVRFAHFEIDKGIDKILAAYDRIFIYDQPGAKDRESRSGRLKEVRIYLPQIGKKGESEPPIIIRSQKADQKDQKPAPIVKEEKKKAEQTALQGNAGKSLADLGKELQEGDEATKIKAMRGLAQLGGVEAMGHLVSALEDPNPEVSSEAERLLTDLYASMEDEEGGNEPQQPVEGAPSFSIDSTGVMTEGAGGQIEVDIRITNVPEKLLGGGVIISYDPSQLSIAGVDVYDGSALAGPWDKEMTGKVENPNNMPGTFMITVGNLSCAVPDENGSINIARARFNKTGSGDPNITLSTIPGYDGFVGDSATVYDPKMPPTQFRLD